MFGKAELEAAFALFDADQSGTLTPSELKAILTRPIPGGSPHLTEAEVDELVKQHDTNGDGVLSIDEFATAWSSLAQRGVAIPEAKSTKSPPPATAADARFVEAVQAAAQRIAWSQLKPPCNYRTDRQGDREGVLACAEADLQLLLEAATDGLGWPHDTTQLAKCGVTSSRPVHTLHKKKYGTARDRYLRTDLRSENKNGCYVVGHMAFGGRELYIDRRWPMHDEIAYAPTPDYSLQGRWAEATNAAAAAEKAEKEADERAAAKKARQLAGRQKKNAALLISACMCHNVAEVKRLLLAERTPTEIPRGWPGETPLQEVAAKSSSAEIMRLLVNAGANIEARNLTTGATPLLEAAIFPMMKGNTGVMRVLIEARADLEATNKKGQTPLIAAAKRGETAAIHALLQAGANKDAKDADGKSALDFSRGRNDALGKRNLALLEMTSVADMDAFVAAQTKSVQRSRSELQRLYQSGPAPQKSAPRPDQVPDPAPTGPSCSLEALMADYHGSLTDYVAAWSGSLKYKDINLCKHKDTGDLARHEGSASGEVQQAAVLSASPLPTSGVVCVELTYTRGEPGSELGSYYYTGLAGGTEAEVAAAYTAKYGLCDLCDEGRFWGLCNYRLFFGNGSTQLDPEARTSGGRVFRSGDSVVLRVDMDQHTMKMYVNGRLLPVGWNRLPPSLYVAATPCHSGATVRIALAADPAAP